MRSVAVLIALALAGCAALAPPPQPGQSEADALARFGPPTGRYPMPDGATRLEFATGPFGRQTWMVDLDSAGRVTSARQVLTEENLAAFQAKAPGMPRDELLRTIGRPGERRGGGRQGGEVWSWRYQTNDCLWFQVSIRDDGLVHDGAFGIDPRCDAPSDARR
jgi:hypothetical protein